MNEEDIIKAVKDLTNTEVFAVLVVLTNEGGIVLRPIGGGWGSGIIDAISEIAEKYTNCRMKLFEQNYDDWQRYFRHVISKEQML